MPLIRLKPLLNRQQGILLLVDLVMVGLILLNISWIIFDSAYSIPELNHFLRVVLGERLVDWYGQELNPHFYTYDLIFVGIFATEFLLRWAWSVWTREHGHWLAYPVFHWYDVLGCIPLGELRLLRLLRLFAIGVRLQKLGVINMRQWWIYQRIKRLYDIVMEEISDRVVIQVLGGMQRELRDGGGIEQQIINEVVRPRQQRLVTSLGQRISSVAVESYQANREALESYITSNVSDAVRSNREVRTIDKMPVIGGAVTGLLDHAITDIVCAVIEGVVTDLSGEEFSKLFDAIANSALESLFDDHVDPNHELATAVIDLLDVVKTQVAKRHWLEPGNEAD